VKGKKLKVLVTGAGGMLGQALTPCLKKRGHDVTALPKEELDVTNYQGVVDTLKKQSRKSSSTAQPTPK
jgi:dTDP-4-dehydrorhamnose reductase